VLGSAVVPDHSILPARPPFVLRARLLTPLGAGGTRHETDAVVRVDPEGRIASVTPASAADLPSDAVDVRPWVMLPGLVDLHAHLPQLPNAGVGAGLDLLAWLDRYIFPLERRFADAAAAERLAPAAFRAFAAAGTTTTLLYGAVFAASLDASFRAAQEHGIRAILGMVMMDRISYEEPHDPGAILERSLRESADLCSRWNGADKGRLRYAFTPRFAVSCSREMLAESAALARSAGAYWQTHIAEDRGEIAEVHRLFPEALDYVDVYDRAGGLGDRTVLAHAIHLSDRELRRLVETGTHVAHCPASNLFLASGLMPLSRYLEAGLVVGLGSDVAAGPDCSVFNVMRVGAYVQNARRAGGEDSGPPLSPADWLRLGTLGGATALGLEGVIGSVEPGKDADLILVDPAVTVPVPGLETDGPDELLSRLIFRAHPAMVRGAWVRGRRLDGPGRPADEQRSTPPSPGASGG
jgi:guanine deaminase